MFDQNNRWSLPLVNKINPFLPARYFNNYGYLKKILSVNYIMDVYLVLYVNNESLKSFFMPIYSYIFLRVGGGVLKFDRRRRNKKRGGGRGNILFFNLKNV